MPERSRLRRLWEILARTRQGSPADHGTGSGIPPEIARLMDPYTTEHLTGTNTKDFRKEIHRRIGRIDHVREDYTEEELEAQRDLSIRFTWGHDHDFGSFQVAGRMGVRHLTLLRDFLELFDLEINSFRGAEVLDVGAWTGGTTLALVAAGAQVTAVEEVRKYAETIRYLASCFGVERQIEVLGASLYQVHEHLEPQTFDCVFFPGVIYHLTDPVLGLRRLFNLCRDGAVILVESAGLDSPEPYCRFEGGQVVTGGSRHELTRTGWNWFIPSQEALRRMMMEAGFREVTVRGVPGSDRIYAYGVRRGDAPITRAGLSVPDVP